MKLRTFIAVDPSPEVQSKIASTIKKLEHETKGFRWVHPEGLHLTLRFLGEIEESVVTEVEAKLEQLVRQFSPISLTSSGIGFFPNPSRPRVVWVGFQGEIDKLASLQKRMEEEVHDLPVHQERERPFSPHLTIARIPDPRTVVGIAKILQAAKEAEFGDFVVDRVILYKSRLTPQGARYSKLKEFILSP